MHKNVFLRMLFLPILVISMSCENVGDSPTGEEAVSGQVRASLPYDKKLDPTQPGGPAKGASDIEYKHLKNGGWDINRAVGHEIWRSVPRTSIKQSAQHIQNNSKPLWADQEYRPTKRPATPRRALSTKRVSGVGFDCFADSVELGLDTAKLLLDAFTGSLKLGSMKVPEEKLINAFNNLSSNALKPVLDAAVTFQDADASKLDQVTAGMAVFLHLFQITEIRAMIILAMHDALFTGIAAAEDGKVTFWAIIKPLMAITGQILAWAEAPLLKVAGTVMSISVDIWYVVEDALYIGTDCHTDCGGRCLGKYTWERDGVCRGCIRNDRLVCDGCSG